MAMGKIFFLISFLFKMNCIWDSDDKTMKNDGNRGLAHVVPSIVFCNFFNE